MDLTEREQKADDQELKELIVKVVKEQRPGSVGELVGIVMASAENDLAASDVIGIVKEMRGEGKIELMEVPRELDKFTSYLMDRDRSLPFWLVLMAIAFTWVLIYAIPSGFPWVIPRWVLGSLFVIFLPGYALVEVLFVNPLSGKKELDEIQRLALSIGMSLALVPLVGLLLNYTPWGIRLEPIVISLSALTLICIVIATYRKFIQKTTKNQSQV